MKFTVTLSQAYTWDYGVPLLGGGEKEWNMEALGVTQQWVDRFVIYVQEMQNSVAIVH